MKKFNITVNGTIYEVEVEEVSADAPAAVAAPAVKEAPKPAAPKAAPAAKPVASGNAGAVKINSPMPGTILKVNVQAGQKVAKGDIVCILEAMKMENEIPAPQDGVVASVNIQNGASVNTGDLLVTLN